MNGIFDKDFKIGNYAVIKMTIDFFEILTLATCLLVVNYGKLKASDGALHIHYFVHNQRCSDK